MSRAQPWPALDVSVQQRADLIAGGRIAHRLRRDA